MSFTFRPLYGDRHEPRPCGCHLAAVIDRDDLLAMLLTRLRSGPLHRRRDGGCFEGFASVLNMLGFVDVMPIMIGAGSSLAARGEREGSASRKT